MKVVTLLVLAAASLSAQDAPIPVELRPNAPPPPNAARAVATVRAYYFAQDFEGGNTAAADLVRWFPASAELRAWQIVNMSRVTGKTDSAVALADADSAWRDPKSPWRSFARSFALNQTRGGSAKAVENAKAVRQSLRWNADAVWLHGFVLHGASKYADVVSLIDSALPRVAATARGNLLTIKANALSSQSGAGAELDTVMRRRAIATFAEARRVDPTNLNAHFLAAANLADGPTDTVALNLMSRSARMTPALTVHQRFWSTVRNRRDLSTQQKDSIVAADVEALLAMRPNASGVIRAAYNQYAEMKRADKAAPLLAKMRAEHRNTVDMGWIDYTAISELRDSVFRKTIDDTAAANARRRAAIAEMSSRPIDVIRPFYGTLLLWTWHDVFEKDATISADSLKRFGITIAKWNTANPHRTHMDIPLRVAELRGDYRWAETMILQGDSIRRAQTEQFKAQTVRSEGVGAYADRLDWLESSKLSALGWIYMHEGRFDEAQKALDKALELQRRDPRVHYHVGKLAEMRGNAAEAQASYSRGYTLESSFTGRQNRDALERVYRANHGSLDGFDAFVERAKAEDRDRRKAKIASDRLKDGGQLASFNLERYGANRAAFSSDSLKGKVAVVNFWGVWCGPCVKEIPDIQKFHAAVKDDPSVVFLTVDYNDTPETLDEFMKKEKLDFPVLLDADRFASDKAKVSGYPTTFFIGRDGKIAWRHMGASDVVLEEFLWRVEMLKATPQP